VGALAAPGQVEGLTSLHAGRSPALSLARVLPARSKFKKEWTMSVNKLFDTIEKARETAQWQAAFGEPQVVEDKTIIPVAQVSYAFGLGFGIGTAPSEEQDQPASTGEGGGTGGGAQARPLGAIVVTPECVYFEEVRDDGRIAMAGIAMAAFVIFQVAKTLRALFGRA
jgi:uncharacterized spore protein YtfJ